MQALPPGGAMKAVQASQDEIGALLEGREHAVSIAAVNGPASVVLSGDAEAVEQVAAQFAAAGRKTRQLIASHAFHSRRMDAMLDAFATLTAGIRHAAPRITMVSTVTGRPVDVTADYWVQQVRREARMSDRLATLSDLGVRTFLELGPDAVLSALGQDCLDDDALAFVPVLRRGRSHRRTLAAALGALHVRGRSPDWHAVFGPGRTPGLQAAGIPADRPFRDMGRDSLTLVEPRNRLQTSAGLRLPATLLLNCPTPTEAVAHLHAELTPADTETADSTATPTVPGLAELDRPEAALAALPDDIHDEARAEITRVAPSAGNQTLTTSPAWSENVAADDG